MMRKNLEQGAWLLCLLGAGLCACGDDKNVLASVNGEEVTQARFDDFLRFKRIPKQDPKRRGDAFESYLERKALAAVIEKQGKLDTGMIDAELEEFKKEMLISRYFEKFLDDAVSDQAVSNYYEAHKKDYEDRKVHVSHILVRVNKAMGETERKVKLTTIRDIHGRLVAGEDFAAVAGEASEDHVSSKRGGDLGWVGEGGVDPKFSKMAFTTQVGEYSEPFESAFGYHIVRVVEAPQVVTKPYRVVAGDIRFKLRNEAKQKELERLKQLIAIEKKGEYKLAPASSAAASAGPGASSAPGGARPNPRRAPPSLQGAHRARTFPLGDGKDGDTAPDREPAEADVSQGASGQGEAQPPVSAGRVTPPLLPRQPAGVAVPAPPRRATHPSPRVAPALPRVPVPAVPAPPAHSAAGATPASP